MTSFGEQDTPHLVVEFVGGPEDGNRMTLPMRKPPTELTPPERPPAGMTATAPGTAWTMLRYTCAKQHPDGHWLYYYQGSFTPGSR
ncbi:MAG TPA: hypothetical protein VFQ77_21710 [Pseudonocardiaceae bacterium]|nr:hypothetical protein [Pseudonocardiaceae bacterium]